MRSSILHVGTHHAPVSQDRCGWRLRSWRLLGSVGVSIVMTGVVSTMLSDTGRAQDAPKIDPSAVEEIQDRGSAKVIVVFKEPDAQEDSAAAFAFSSPARYLSATVGDGMQRVAAVEGAGAGTAVAEIADQTALEELVADPRVAFVTHNVADFPTLIETVELNGAQVLWGRGHVGGDYAIAVLDTGFQADHGFLDGKVVEQACFSLQDEARGIQSLCPGGEVLATGEVVDLSPGSATNCPSDTFGCDHGTHVAGIAAGKDVTDPDDAGRDIAGVAKGADIVAIQVFSRFTRANDCFPFQPPCVKAFRSSQLRALEYVESLVLRRQAVGRGPEIVAVNMSLGGGMETTPCDDRTPLTRPIRQLRELGVATFVASGNEGFRTAVAQPACISHAMAVGAIDKNGGMANFTNRDRFGDLIDFMTVGVGIRSSVFGGGFGPKSGTSMATPAAAGAYAVLKSAHRSLTLDQLEQAMKNSGPRVTDPVSGTDFAVIDVAQAADGVSGPAVVAGPADAAEVGEVAEEAGAQPATGAETGQGFIVEVPSGEAAASTAAVSEAADSLSEALGAGKLDVAPLGSSQLSIRTERPVERGVLEEQLREAFGGGMGKVYLDEADRPLSAE